MAILGLIFVAIGLEAFGAWRLRKPLYEGRDSELSLGLAFGWVISGVVGAALAAVTINFGYHHRLVNLGASRFGGLIVIILADVIYYGWHRLNHIYPWLWASHFPHHTAKRLNVLASVRQGWSDVLSGTWLFWASLGFLGFTPAQTGLYFSILLVWEACVHSEWMPKLGPLEWLFVTPSNHRIHHSLDPAHLDRNFGGVFVVWDRLFGTYVPEGDKPIDRFGVAGFDADRSTPVGIALWGWRDMFAQSAALRLARKGAVSGS